MRDAPSAGRHALRGVYKGSQFNRRSRQGGGMHCTKCGTESTTGRKFCAACGSPLAIHCPNCDAVNAPSSLFCEDCGVALDSHAASAAKRSAAASAIVANRAAPEGQDESTTPEGERKIVTALFADLKGSTQLMADLDPEAAHAIVAPLLRRRGVQRGQPVPHFPAPGCGIVGVLDAEVVAQQLQHRQPGRRLAV